ncbi:MAG TPA: dienelactone hydrolase family protein [Steroidobacteraceae bacterium]|nr:dienelactone hydrolase family protein [Steroidobacteraceae bacterium]
MSELEPIAFHHEGDDLRGEIVAPPGGERRPAVLVMHTALGLSDHMRQQACLLTQRGYVAVATDMYGGGRYLRDPQNEAADTYMRLTGNPLMQRRRTVAWYEKVRQLPNVDPTRIAAIGYCYGGRCVLELARSGADLKAVVSYHGLLDTHEPARPGSIKGIVAVYTGALDPYAPQKDVEALRQEMSEAQARLQLTVFSHAAHGFTDPHASKAGLPGIEYDAIAEKVSWAGTLALLQSELGT